MENSFNKVYFKSSAKMKEVPDCSVDVIVTSPPYFNIKDYFKDGWQEVEITKAKQNDVGNINNFDDYIKSLIPIWKECFRVLKPNGKLCVNVPLMPIIKKDYSSHYNRDIFDIQSEIQHSILRKTAFYLMDIYIWHRKNSTKKLMFGSYPYPSNFYAQNVAEFISIYVKDGKPEKVSKKIKEKSKLTEEEWVEYTKQIWDIAIPNKKDLAFGIHSAIMPEEIARRCIKMFSFAEGVVLDPFTGSGTTLKVAKELGRQYVGYELYESYAEVINKKLESVGG
jgi:site-specific DNA-methyltransferase (cytosine-N4-specific)